jgi:hypothetical protein
MAPAVYFLFAISRKSLRSPSERAIKTTLRIKRCRRQYYTRGLSAYVALPETEAAIVRVQTPSGYRHSDKEKFRSDLKGSKSRKMSERLLKTLRKSGDFQAEYKGSIPFALSNVLGACQPTRTERVEWSVSGFR